MLNGTFRDRWSRVDQQQAILFLFYFIYDDPSTLSPSRVLLASPPLTCSPFHFTLSPSRPHHHRHQSSSLLAVPRPLLLCHHLLWLRCTVYRWHRSQLPCLRAPLTFPWHRWYPLTLGAATIPRGWTCHIWSVLGLVPHR